MRPDGATVIIKFSEFSKATLNRTHKYRCPKEPNVVRHIINPRSFPENIYSFTWDLKMRKIGFKSKRWVGQLYFDVRRNVSV